MAIRGGLNSVRQALLAAYLDNSIDDVEFAFLYDANSSRESFPYWKFPDFNFDDWDNTECNTELRFAKSDVLVLLDALDFPEKFVCSQRTTCTGLEGRCILLKRLAFPCRYTDLASRFGRNPTELCLIFNQVLDFVYERHSHRLRSWDQPFLSPEMLGIYAEAVHDKGAALQNCFGFVNGTLRRIARPKRNPRVMYNGHNSPWDQVSESCCAKWTHSKFVRALWGETTRQHDAVPSGILNDLQRHTWLNGQPLCIHGDPAYPCTKPSLHLQAQFRDAQMTPHFNKSMSEVRASVEWVFGDISNFYKFLIWRGSSKCTSPVGKIYIIWAILQNAHTCTYGNIVSEYFGVSPPSLQDYFM